MDNNPAWQPFPEPPGDCYPVRKTVTYEQPLNERIRSFLRLEFLFKQAEHFLRGASAWNSHVTLGNLLEIQNLLSRSDLKTEVLKELERHTANLARLEQNPEVDRERLAEILDELDSIIDRLYSNNQQLGHDVKHNEFLTSIRQRMSIPGGTCDFDLPGYHHWLQQPNERRIRDLDGWLAAYDVLRRGIHMILRLLRESGTAIRKTAVEGFYQQSLDANTPCQLLRIGVPAELNCFPEVSGGKHRFTIRFMRQDSPDERAVQFRENMDFQLSCCMI